MLIIVMFSFNINNVINNVTRIMYYNNFIRSFCVKHKKADGFLNFAIKDTFSPETSASILKMVNEATPQDLARYKISSRKIKVMLDWKKKKGPFKSLSEVLEVECFDEEILEKIGNNIAYENVPEVKCKLSKKNKPIKQLLIPDMDVRTSTTLQSAVAIHLDPTGIGWARLEYTNKLTDWKYKNFGSLPMKMLPSDNFNLALELVRTTPIGSAYVFEAPSTLSPQSQTKQVLISTHNQEIELISMLLSLLNTSRQHNDSLQELSTEKYYSRVENRVFYLKSKIPARLFSTLIGYEKVSAISAMMAIMKKDPEHIQTVPCTPVIFETNLIDYFLNQSSTNKELLAQALMLGMSFMDLCIHRNSASYEALRTNHSKKIVQTIKQFNLREK